MFMKVTTGAATGWMAGFPPGQAHLRSLLGLDCQIQPQYRLNHWIRESIGRRDETRASLLRFEILSARALKFQPQGNLKRGTPFP